MNTTTKALIEYHESIIEDTIVKCKTIDPSTTWAYISIIQLSYDTIQLIEHLYYQQPNNSK